MNQWGGLLKCSKRLPQLIFSAKRSTFRRGTDLAFGKYLLATNTVASGLLFSLGDLIQQEIEYVNWKKHTESFEWNRNLNMLLVGIMQGPIAHCFYTILDSKLPGKTVPIIARKVVLDQSIASPMCISQFFLTLNALEGNTLKDGYEELRKKFLAVYTTDCCYWIPTQILNFFVVSAKYRLLYINFMTMIYNAFLSYMKFTYEV